MYKAELLGQSLFGRLRTSPKKEEEREGSEEAGGHGMKKESPASPSRTS